ncbi:hypothetical protein, partial [Streptomyces sp. NPDC094468]|uniref:hypothetical protein n=1 Tax=Streptomyces sp. NPDC094468 TaxID=3366066 RepID=UPI0038197E3B
DHHTTSPDTGINRNPRMPLDNHQTTQPQPHPPYGNARIFAGAIEFASQSSQLTGPDHVALQKIVRLTAYLALDNGRSGLPPLSVEVVGHSNGIREGAPHYGLSRERGMERAQNVAGYFSSILSFYSQFFQEKRLISQPLEMDIKARSAGLELPFGSTLDDHPVTARRRAVIWVNRPLLLGNQAEDSDATGDAIRSQEEADRDVELQQMKNQIAAEFGITLDSAAGVRAIIEHQGLGVDPESTRQQIKSVQWSVSAVRQIIDALKHFKPILGSDRETSSRNGVEQEVNTIGNVTWTLVKGEPYPSATGQYIGEHKNLNIYTYAHAAEEEVRNTVVHELAHGLLEYALPDFTAEFWTGHHQSPRELMATPLLDFTCAIAQHIGYREALARQSPPHAAAMVALEKRRPDIFIKRSDETPASAASRIAHELRGDLDWFAQEVGTWTRDGKPQTFFFKERPITGYGEKNSDEDLAETAKVYFTDADRLRNWAPLRAAFMDRLVEGWHQRRDTYSGDHAREAEAFRADPAKSPAETDEPLSFFNRATGG